MESSAQLSLAAGARTQVHDVVSADGAVVDDNVPGPEGDGVPLMMLVFVLIGSDSGSALRSSLF